MKVRRAISSRHKSRLRILQIPRQNALKKKFKMSHRQREYSVHQYTAPHPYTRCARQLIYSPCHFIPATGLLPRCWHARYPRGPGGGKLAGWWNRDRGLRETERGIDLRGRRRGKRKKKKASEIKRESAMMDWAEVCGGGGGSGGCYRFLLGQQTVADSRMAYLSAGIPRPHQRQRQEGGRRRPALWTQCVLQNAAIATVKTADPLLYWHREMQPEKWHRRVFSELWIHFPTMMLLKKYTIIWFLCETSIRLGNIHGGSPNTITIKQGKKQA